MNYEENRLNTFINWPSSAAVQPIRIAKAGFYFTGQGVEVQCFSCGGKISEWNYSDQVMAKHRQLDPNCPFVANQETSGNIPLILNQTESGSLAPLEDMPSFESSTRPSENIPSQNSNNNGLTDEDELYRNDALRLLSFVNWPLQSIPREPFANAGLYHLRGGIVRCAWCGGELSEVWSVGDIPLITHRYQHPDCQHAIELLNVQLVLLDEHFVIMSPRPGNSTTAVSQTPGATHNERVLDGGIAWRSLGLVGSARHGNCAALSARLSTYRNWPQNRKQTPAALAEAGFYYGGEDDRVRCFYCDGGLGAWEPDDVPWNEHAHWFPDCGYVLLMKGQDFINQCKIRRTAANVMEEQMETPAVLAVLSAGLDAGRVHRVVAKKLRLTGQPFSSSEALIDAVLDDQVQEDWGSAPVVEDMDLEILSDAIRNITPSSHQSDNSESGNATPEPAVSSCSAANTAKGKPPIRVIAESSPKLNTENLPNISKMTAKKQLSLEEENRQLKEARLCKVCMDNEVSLVFLPCGHMVTCGECGSLLKKCPLCRGAVRAFVRAYLA